MEKPTTSPISTNAPRRRADRHVEQSAGERARRGGPAGAGRGDRGGRGRRRDQGGRHPLRRPDLLRRRRHHRIRQAAGHAVAARRWSTRSRIARSRWSRRSTAPRSAAGSRSRSAAITASRCRTRSSACPRSSWACFRAPAGRSACRASPASRRRWKCARRGNPIGAKEAFDCGLVDRLVEGELVQHAVGYAEEVRDVRPLPKSSERAGQARSARQPGDLRRIPQGQCPQVPRLRGARKPTSRRSRRRSPSPMPKASSTSATCSWS